MTETLDPIKSILEELCDEKNFSGHKMFQKIDPIITANFSELVKTLKQQLDTRNYSYLIASLLRNVFLIELVNNDISSTKMEVRWTVKKSEGKKQESFDNNDPRFCTFDGCKTIFLDLLKKLIIHLQKQKKLQLLILCAKYNLIPYELPLDYVSIQNQSNRLHEFGNLDWFWDKKYYDTFQLRKFLLSKTGKKSKIFSKILKDKLKVKTYLTDRVQTGEHKTNREKRWESHPKSVHFALRKDCLLIEKKLISQVCNFVNFPKTISNKIVPFLTSEKSPYRCPITLEPMIFNKFKKEVLDPNHGLSSFPYFF